jgi:hypothetical protein
MVWISLPTHNLRNTTDLRQILHLLLNQMGLPYRPVHLRNRLLDLRCCAQQHCTYHWTRGCGCGRCWYLLRGHLDHLDDGAVEAATYLYGTHRGHVWYC